MSITNHTFDDMDVEDKINYAQYIFIKIKEVLYYIISTFEIYRSIDNRLNNLINPVPIIIKFTPVHSEIEFEDLLFLIES